MAKVVTYLVTLQGLLALEVCCLPSLFFCCYCINVHWSAVFVGVSARYCVLFTDLFIIFMSPYQVYFFFYKAHTIYVCNALLTPGFFGIKGNNINFSNFKAYFLLSYGSMSLLALSRGVLVVIECR